MAGLPVHFFVKVHHAKDALIILSVEIDETPNASPLKDILSETPFVYGIQHFKERYKIALACTIFSYENINTTQWQSFNPPYGLIILYCYLFYHSTDFRVYAAKLHTFPDISKHSCRFCIISHHNLFTLHLGKPNNMRENFLIPFTTETSIIYNLVKRNMAQRYGLILIAPKKGLDACWKDNHFM